MKTFLLLVTCFISLNAFAQTSESITQERASAWVRVTENPITPAKPATVTNQAPAVKKTTTKKTTTPKPNAQQEFEKTNSEVNRFKKKKG